MHVQDDLNQSILHMFVGAFFIRKMLISFLFLDKNIHSGHSLEAPRRSASNEYPQRIFSSRNKKNIMWIPLLISSYDDRGFCCPLTETWDTIKCINGDQRPR